MHKYSGNPLSEIPELPLIYSMYCAKTLQPLTVIIVNVDLQSVDVHVDVLLHISNLQSKVPVFLECHVIKDGNIQAAAGGARRKDNCLINIFKVRFNWGKKIPQLLST